MEIIVNGEARQVPEDITIAQMEADLGLVGQSIAVEVNLDIIPRSIHVEHVLRAGDRGEIVRAIGVV